MLSFLSAFFAIAGSIAALAPIILHLWSRRKFRVVHWAAMDFLRQAAARSRRVLRLRDLLLLVLRTVALLLFGFAMARPYLARSDSAAIGDEPVHAVIVIDNSLSMTYELLTGTLLDEAKAKAKDLIGRLPNGSWISVLPLCGSAASVSRDAYRTREDAVEWLLAIEAVDRQGTAAQAIALASEAVARVSEFTAHRVVFLSDQQAVNWPQGFEVDPQSLPDIEIVDVSAPDSENAWVASLTLKEGVAEGGAPTALTASVRLEGKSPRLRVPVTLTVGGVKVATQMVDLQPGQRREITFVHTFDAPSETTRITFVPAVVSLPPDRLPGDDQRSILVPIGAGLPVVFLDSLGGDEEPARGQYGETYCLRQLLASTNIASATSRELARASHQRFGDLTRASIAGARVIVVAGVKRPGSAVQLLREHVEQGGSLLMTAGAEFDPASWTSDAWLGGLGILPAPLKPECVGRLPGAGADELKPLGIAVDTISSDYFLLPGIAREEINDLFSEPLFFRVAAADVSVGAMEELVRNVSLRASEETSKQEIPRVLAKLANGLPILLERQIGKGSVVFFASGVHSEWSTLTRTPAVILFDRLLRSLLARTLPRRDVEPREAIVIPVELSESQSNFTLTRPIPLGRTTEFTEAPAPEPLFVEALDAEKYGLTLRHAIQRGLYTVRCERGTGSLASTSTPMESITFAVNGPEGESELRSVREDDLRNSLAGARWRWVPRSEPIAAAGAAPTSGQASWRWLMGSVLVLLLLELVVGASTRWAATSSSRGASLAPRGTDA